MPSQSDAPRPAPGRPAVAAHERTGGAPPFLPREASDLISGLAKAIWFIALREILV